MRDWAKLHVDISKSKSFAAVRADCPDAAVLFLMMLPHTDVLGIVDADPVVFMGTVCPRFGMTAEEVDLCLGVLQQHDMIVAYEDADGDRYLWVRNWAKFQAIRWTHVGATSRPLPEGWEPPDGLNEHCMNNPTHPLSRSTARLRENYCSTTVILPQYYSTERRARDSDVEVDSDSEKDPAPQDGAAAEAVKNERQESDQQAAIRAAFEGLTGEALPKALPGYSGMMKLVTEYGLPMIREWTSYLKGQEPNVPEGANAWAYFKTTFRQAMNRDFKWRGEGGNAPSSEKQSWRDWPERFEVECLTSTFAEEELPVAAASPDYYHFPTHNINGTEQQRLEKAHRQYEREQSSGA